MPQFTSYPITDGIAGAVNSATNRGYEERAIAHPGFKNMSRLEAEAYLADKDVWSCVIRPSSKGLSHLTLTWKIAESRDFRPDSMLDSDVVAEAKASPWPDASTLFENVY